MKHRLLEYYRAEEYMALALLVIGILALSIGLAGFFLIENPFWTGSGLTLAIFGFFEIARGGVHLIASKRQPKALLALERDFPSQVVKTEYYRISEQLNQLYRRRKIEGLLFILGVFLLLYAGTINPSELSLGLGVGLSIQAAILFVFTLITQWRAGLYQHEVERLRQ